MGCQDRYEHSRARLLKQNENRRDGAATGPWSYLVVRSCGSGRARPPRSRRARCAEDTAVSSALVVKLDFSPAPASDAAAALAPTATASAATMVASLSAAAFLRLLINAAASAITAAMKLVRRLRT